MRVPRLRTGSSRSGRPSPPGAPAPRPPGRGGNVPDDDGPGPDEGEAADSQAAHDRGVGAESGSLPDCSRPEFLLALDEGARIEYIGERHGGTAEHAVFQQHPFVDRNVVLDLAAAADPHLAVDVDVLAENAVFADSRSGHDVAEMPDPGSASDLARLVDHRGGVGVESRVGRHGRSREWPAGR